LPYKDKDKRKRHAKEYGADWYQRNRRLFLNAHESERKNNAKSLENLRQRKAAFFVGQAIPQLLIFTTLKPAVMMPKSVS